MSGAAATASSQRVELLLALAAGCDTPSAGASAQRALGLRPMSPEEHTAVFVLNLPPHASVYLGPEGQLGGEAADRVAGFWRALRLVPPRDPDHLTSLLALYAQLSAAADDQSVRATTRSTMGRMAHSLLWEHLWPWVPAYTLAIETLGVDSCTVWARILRRCLLSDLPCAADAVGEQLPLALREAPAALDETGDVREVLDALVAPIRSGIILTRKGLARASATIGVGYRIGERRFALKGMLEQEPVATVAWLGHEAERWSTAHAHGGSDLVSQWWATRAKATARALTRQVVASATISSGEVG
jgi:TorA maturation chaperone TorD